MRRAALLVLLAATAAGCGGGTAAERPAQPVSAGGSGAISSTGPAQPTPEQLAAREELLRAIQAGEVECWCTSAERARDRIRSGKAQKPAPQDLVSALP